MLKEQVKIHGNWYTLKEIGKDHLTIINWSEELVLVNKYWVEGYKLV
jgi:hypothetical protein